MELVLGKIRRGAAARQREDGFSLIEVLIAAGLLLVIAVGIIPLFTHAMLNTIGGAESTTVSNYGKTHLEELMSLPVSDAALQIPGGSTEFKVEEYWSLATESWVPGATPAPGDPGTWVRTTTIKQYNINDLDEGEPGFETPVDGNNSINAHIKEITVTIESTREGGPLAKGKELTLRVYKEF